MTDQPLRDMLVTTFDRNFLVEAAAGSGKTTILVERLVQMIAGGHAKVQETGMLTFTRKAAAEMQARFFLRLEQLVRDTEDERIKKRLREALEQRHQTYIGTIHGFCARLLHEYAAQAGLPPAFREIEPEEETKLRREVWQAWLAKCDEENQDLDGKTWRARLHEVGLNLEDLQHEFNKLCEFSDIANWPAEKMECPDYCSIIPELIDYLAQMRKLAPLLPTKIFDKLMAAYRRLPRFGAVEANRTPPAATFFHFLERFRPIARKDVKVKSWPDGQATGNREWERWNQFCEQKVAPLLNAWRAYRYPFVLAFLKESARYYEQERLRRGLLTYQDLLLGAVRLVKANPVVRRSIARQWKRLLVDEFQDTDPLQAELLFLITAERKKDDNKASRPGSLFLVGDPQQSIYRFRRADMAIYDMVKKNWSANDVVHLTTNFRSQPSLVAWINSTFVNIFSEHKDPYQAKFVPMEPGREQDAKTDSSLCILPVPVGGKQKTKEAIAQYEAEAIALFITQSLRTQNLGLSTNLNPDDFLILTTQRNRLSAYSQALRRWNIPHQVTGGAGLNEFPGLRLLQLLLVAATQPENEVAVVGLLRSELCGLSDVELFEYQRGGGKFQWDTLPDQSIPHTESVSQLFQNLRTLARNLGMMSITAALESTLIKIGVPLWSQAQSETGLGDLASTLIYMRQIEMRSGTVQGVLAGLQRLMEREPRRDGLFVPAEEGIGVRIMNLHKAKGLEARVVILADSGANWQIPSPNLHVKRDETGARGYLHIKRQFGGYASISLAHSLDWQQHEEEEIRYLEAERCRLLYVAATRARDLLVICSQVGQKEDLNKHNPWSNLIDCLTNAKKLNISIEEAVGNEQQQLPATLLPSLQPLSSAAEAWSTCLTPTAQIPTDTRANQLTHLHNWAQEWQSNRKHAK